MKGLIGACTSALAVCFQSSPRVVAILFFVATCWQLPRAFAEPGREAVDSVQVVSVPDWTTGEKVAFGFVPNDPYYTTGNPAGFPGQWHLSTQASGATYDANVVGAWNRNLTGQGVTIGIVDSGVEHTHPDLSPNYVAADSFDFGQNDFDPSPVYSNSSATAGDGDDHGTSVAGIAAARGGNGIGGTGAAPNAGLAGLRVDFRNQTSAMFANAILYHSSGANTSIKVKNHSYGDPTSYSADPIQSNALLTSNGAGTIHVFAAGNERQFHGSFVIDANNNSVFDPDIDPAFSADANLKSDQAMKETVDVAALGSSGRFATYSNWGANIWVTAPSNSFRAGELSITTTDRTGGAVSTGGYNNSAGNSDNDAFPDLNYTSIFGGTSAASPLVAGIMALGKEVQPNLNERFAKHLLARTSKVVDPGDTDVHSNCLALPVCVGGWVTNGAGFKFNENYGFGLIDADAFTLAATQYSGVTSLATESIATQSVAAVIPDANAAGIDRSFNFTGLQPLEEIEVHLNVSHAWRGDLEAFLTSPSGTTSRLMYQNGADSFNDIDWTFTTNEFWGEIPAGVWRLTVRDVFAGDTGTWNSFSVVANMGTLVAVPEPASLVLIATAVVGALCRRSRRS